MAARWEIRSFDPHPVRQHADQRIKAVDFFGVGVAVLEALRHAFRHFVLGLDGPHRVQQPLVLALEDINGGAQAVIAVHKCGILHGDPQAIARRFDDLGLGHVGNLLFFPFLLAPFPSVY